MKMIEQIIKKYNLGDITGDILPVSGGLMHKMFKVQTSTGTYAVKHLNPEIMKRPGVMENYKKAEALEKTLEDNNISIVGRNLKINTILFDMYGVILCESKGNFIPYTYTHFDQSEYDRITGLFKEKMLFTRAALGEMTSDEFLTQLGYANPHFHMMDYIDNYLTLDEGFITFAEKYASLYDFVLLSNDVSEWSEYITEHHGLNRYFKHKIVSGDVKCRKPDRKIYEIALETIGKSPEECIFVDNSVKNLRVAGELGIQSILFNRDKEEYEGVVVNSFEELAELISEKYG